VLHLWVPIRARPPGWVRCKGGSWSWRPYVAANRSCVWPGVTASAAGGLPPDYVPARIRELITTSSLFGVGAGPAEAGAEAKQAAANAAGVAYFSELCGR
jgi:hypothetical protein